MPNTYTNGHMTAIDKNSAISVLKGAPAVIISFMLPPKACFILLKTSLSYSVWKYVPVLRRALIFVLIAK